MDGDQLEELYRTRGRALLSYAYRLTGHRQDAEDLLHETLMRCAQRWSRTMPDAPEAYVRGALAKGAISRWRLVQRQTARLAPEELFEPFPESDDRLYLWQAMGTLTRTQRAVLVLRYYEDLSEAEIANVLCIRPGTVKSQAHRGLAQLRALIEERERSEKVSHG